jgi:hypothetical protein
MEKRLDIYSTVNRWLLLTIENLSGKGTEYTPFLVLTAHLSICAGQLSRGCDQERVIQA